MLIDGVDGAYLLAHALELQFIDGVNAGECAVEVGHLLTVGSEACRLFLYAVERFGEQLQFFDILFRGLFHFGSERGLGALQQFLVCKTNNVEQVGLRNVIDADECDKVFKYLDGEATDESDNWNQRYRDNMDKLKRGSIYEIADVVKSLKKRETEKGLSSVERKMFISAKNVLITELSYASGKTVSDIEMCFDSLCQK